MTQTILTVVAEVQPASAALLRERIDALVKQQETKQTPHAQSYDALRSAVPVLHFMSITVASDDQYDPVWVLEANFDGTPGPFWAQLEAAIGTELRAMLRLCKTPRDERGTLFEAVTRAGSSVPLAPLLEALSVLPAVQHQGNRGLLRQRIIDEGKLFQALRQQLDDTPAATSGSLSAAQLHQQLRAALLPRFAWLDQPAAPRIPRAEQIADWARGLGFVALLLAVLTLTGWLLWQIVAALCGPLPTPQVWWQQLLALLGLTLVGLLALGLPAALRLRWLEQRDAATDTPRQDQAALREMARREDFIAQNHMISIVHIKPGGLRMLLAQLVLKALGLLLRSTAHDGYLKSMRTIHFAHWAWLDHGGRLMFHSNFDGSWESYLDDFIEKAHDGLTLAWTHGVGFPPTRWLFQGGATEGRKFKAWARHSMSQSTFWFSAYKEYSVNQIERQARVADGLRRPALTEQEAAAWAIDL